MEEPLPRFAARQFNDQLTLILNQAAVSLELLGPEHPASRSLVDLQTAARRCAELSQGLLLASC